MNPVTFMTDFSFLNFSLSGLIKYLVVIYLNIKNCYSLYFKVAYLIVAHRWQEVERLRAERNVVANKMKGKLESSVRQSLVEEGGT